jgi:lycopene cyclase domain-containing protein
LNERFLYLTLDLASISIPLLFSFYKQAPFYKTWKSLFPAIAFTALLFIAWDEWFTQIGVWGFNPRYLTGIYLGRLPLEEILFFICIPYACLFTYFALKHLIKKDHLFPHQEIISSAIIILMLLIGLHQIEKWYTGVTFITLGIFLTFQLLKIRPRYMGRFYLAYAVILIPFFIVNGILTGSFIEQEVVWYNNEENLGVRIGTVPVEDIFYGMLLILMNVVIYEWLQEKNPGMK